MMRKYLGLILSVDRASSLQLDRKVRRFIFTIPATRSMTLIPRPWATIGFGTKVGRTAGALGDMS